MLIASLYFAAFVLVVLGVHVALPQRWRWVWLLVASYAFYLTWSVRYAVVLLVMSVFSFVVARWIEAAQEPTRKKQLFALGVLACFAVLGVFKYTNFALSSVDSWLAWTGVGADIPRLSLFYPIGIAFFSLQMISYVNDVYSGAVPAERHVGKYMLYISFFPQLIAGPIERAKPLLPQLSLPRRFEYQIFVGGLIRMSWGFWKKLVIADRVAVVTGIIFDTPDAFAWYHLLFAVGLYSIQIYADFSAYCDIVIGAANLFGITLTENFNHPYFATSPIDFWRRWHISFSTWLRDYIFYPLNFAARRNLTPWVQTRNILLVFLFSGLWHGAAWTFVIWGGLHGAYQAIELTLQRMARKRKTRHLLPFWKPAYGILLTFVSITFAWIFFRANSVGDALTFIERMLSLRAAVADHVQLQELDAQLDLGLVGVLLALFAAIEFLQFRSAVPVWEWLRTRSLPLRWGVCLVLLFSVIIFGYYGEDNPSNFIYAGF